MSKEVFCKDFDLSKPGIDKLDLAFKCSACIFFRNLDCLKMAYVDSGVYGTAKCVKCYVPTRAESYLFEYLYRQLSQPDLFVALISRYIKLRNLEQVPAKDFVENNNSRKEK